MVEIRDGGDSTFEDSRLAIDRVVGLSSILGSVETGSVEIVAVETVSFCFQNLSGQIHAKAIAHWNS